MRRACDLIYCKQGKYVEAQFQRLPLEKCKATRIKTLGHDHVDVCHLGPDGTRWLYTHDCLSSCSRSSNAQCARSSACRLNLRLRDLLGPVTRVKKKKKKKHGGAVPLHSCRVAEARYIAREIPNFWGNVC